MSKQIAIVTGAAKGIGKAIAQRLVQENYLVVLVDIDKTNTELLADQLGENAVFKPCDISKEEEVQALFVELISEFNKIDILVNNAGILRDNMIWNMPSEDFDSVMDVNLRGPWLTCREAAKQMRQQKSGRIVNIASRAWLGNRGQSNYSASKAGIVGLTRVLALELGKYGVCVNAIAPGLINTPLVQALPQDVQDRLIEAQPTKSMGRPEDVANAVAFLVSDSTQFINGQTLYVDGGKSIGAGI